MIVSLYQTPYQAFRDCGDLSADFLAEFAMKFDFQCLVGLIVISIRMGGIVIGFTIVRLNIPRFQENL